MKRTRRVLPRRRQKAQPLSFHKEKWLARLSCPTAFVKLIQMASSTKECTALLIIRSKSKSRRAQKAKHVPLQQRRPLPFNAKVFRALDALVVEGKIQTTMPYEEWQTQIALGTAFQRTFFKDELTKDKVL